MRFAYLGSFCWDPRVSLKDIGFVGNCEEICRNGSQQLFLLFTSLNCHDHVFRSPTQLHETHYLIATYGVMSVSKFFTSSKHCHQNFWGQNTLENPTRNTSKHTALRRKRVPPSYCPKGQRRQVKPSLPPEQLSGAPPTPQRSAQVMVKRAASTPIWGCFV